VLSLNPFNLILIITLTLFFLGLTTFIIGVVMLALRTGSGELRSLAAQTQTWLEQEGWRQTRLIGPAPCFFARIGGLYRWQIVLCGPTPAEVLRGRNLGEWRIEVNPPNLL